jgi:hypothetical protein
MPRGAYVDSNFFVNTLNRLRQSQQKRAIAIALQNMKTTVLVELLVHPKPLEQ